MFAELADFKPETTESKRSGLDVIKKLLRLVVPAKFQNIVTHEISLCGLKQSRSSSSQIKSAVLPRFRFRYLSTIATGYRTLERNKPINCMKILVNTRFIGSLNLARHL